MGKAKIAHGEFVVVCDGAKALVLENVGDEKFLNLKTRQVFDQPDPKTREIGTDGPGRAFNSMGHGRSAMEQVDLHTQEEERFLQKLVANLDAAVRAGQIKSLMIVAPPPALGVLRPAYTHDLRNALRGEVDKDFVKMPVHEIEKHLAA